MPTEDMLANDISWHTGTERKLKALAAVRVPEHRSGSGTRVCNICQATRLGLSANIGCRERRNTISPTGQRRRTCAPLRPSSRRNGFASRLTNNLGLDHFEGDPGKAFTAMRSLTMIAYAFLQHRRLKTAKAGKKNQRATTATDLALSWNSSLDQRRNDARIAKNGFATSRSVSKSTKVTLARAAGVLFGYPQLYSYSTPWYLRRRGDPI
ncbi:hypothetical protein H1B27_30810 [Bradyrhizobium sp. CNPSo 4019]|uniref:Uncharacterized protein n=1 Tax=Bradyrhizobium diversitatis TaxID=2755406 RepID=A0ABS0PBF9_9BRAD|nr:hypothetical protein [Bradyrhizobium diversitatis]